MSTETKPKRVRSRAIMRWEINGVTYRFNFTLCGVRVHRLRSRSKNDHVVTFNDIIEAATGQRMLL